MNRRVALATIALVTAGTCVRGAKGKPVNPLEGRPVSELHGILRNEPSEAVRVNAVRALDALVPQRTGKRDKKTKDAPAPPQPAAKDVVNALADGLNDEACAVRAHAMKALGRAGEFSVPALIEALGSDRVDTRAYAAGALAEMSTYTWPEPPPAARAVSALTEALKDKDYSVRVAASRALGDLGANATPALPLLLKLLNDGEWAVVDEAVQAVAAVDPGGTKSVPALTKALGNRKHDVREFVCNELRDMGPNARSAIPALVKQLDGDRDSWYAVKAAAEALVAIDTDGNRAVAEIAKRIPRKEPPFLKRYLLEALLKFEGEIGPEVKPAMPYAVEKLEEWLPPPLSAWVPRKELLRFLGKAGPHAKDKVVPTVRKLLEIKGLDERQARKPLENLLKEIEG